MQLTALGFQSDFHRYILDERQVCGPTFVAPPGQAQADSTMDRNQYYGRFSRSVCWRVRIVDEEEAGTTWLARGSLVPKRDKLHRTIRQAARANIAAVFGITISCPRHPKLPRPVYRYSS